MRYSLQDLETLPDHLIQNVLHQYSDCLDEQISHLPKRLHSLAVHGAFPSIRVESSLTLSCENWALPSAVAVLKCFAQLPHSESLCIRHCPQLQNSEVSEFVAAIMKAVSAKPLKLSFSRLGGFVSNAVVRAFPANIESIRQLTMLNFESNDLENSGAEMLAACLVNMSHLETLVLEDNRIGDQGASAIATGIKSLKKLKKLEIGGNDFAEPGARALSKSLSCTPQLQYLGLEAAGSYAAVEIVKELTSAEYLQSLKLKANGLRDGAAKALFRSTANLRNLQDLWLDFNRIKGEGAVALAENLNTLNQLQLSLIHI